MDDVVAPLLHNNDPPNEPAVNTELPQLFTTVTVGDEGIAFTVSVAGLEFTEPPLFVQTARYCLLLSAIVVANVCTTSGATDIGRQCHCTLLPLRGWRRVSICAKQNLQWLRHILFVKTDVLR
jgi:hypothetical protein